ncbi:MAG: tetratricopeptide repeat protein [Thermoanaerobaculia bacterium]
MSTYPGNMSLASAVRERVNSTFRQALELYRAGRTDEVIQGCTLILQMDPLFDPAKKLLEKTRNPSSPIDVESLMPGQTHQSLNEARTAMASRDFERVLQITSEILTNDLMNDEARVLADEAREKLEAGPFIDQFVRKCETSLGNGNLSAARTDLEKARALDSSHPGVRRIEQMIAAKESAAPAASSSSFVVDAPAQAGRSTTQASDFGFTFEEEKGDKKQQPQNPSFANFSFESPAKGETPLGGGFSFDTPVSSPAATPSFSFDSPGTKPPGNEFDFSTASIETTPDDKKKIDQYLQDGDRAFDSGNSQQAIDLWSRIFLIDVTNEAASERIERAKAKRRESEQKIETILTAGVQALERKEAAQARAKFKEVLSIDPGNVTAQDYLQRVDSPAASAPAFAPSAQTEKYDSSLLDEDSSEGGYGAAAPAPPAPAARRPAAGKAAPKPSAASAKRPTALIAVVVIVLVVIAGGWFAWTKFMRHPATDPGAAHAAFDRATELSQQGKYDQAMTTLQEIKPGDSQYEKALGMIDEIQRKKAKASATIDGKPAGLHYDENVAAGRAAFDAHDYVSAKKSFEQAMRVKPLPADVRPAYDQSAQQVGKLESARSLFAERKYQDAIATLQSLLQQDPQNRNVQRMILDAHFNLGATALQDERLPDAKREFDEVLKADPSDELAKRSKDLADRYDGQPKDLLYKIYVKYLPLR